MGRRSPWRLLALVGPLAAWLLIFEVIPLVLVLAVSFMRRGVQGPIEVTFTLENYARFADPLYVRILADSLWIALVTTAICLLVGYPFAYYACQQPPERRARLLGLVILPFWTNMLIRTYAWIVLLRSNGLVNNVLRGAGVIQQPLELLYTREAAVLGLVYALLPFMILPLYASIEKLDWRLVKAAQDLGGQPRPGLLAGDAAADHARGGGRVGAGVRAVAGAVLHLGSDGRCPRRADRQPGPAPVHPGPRLALRRRGLGDPDGGQPAVDLRLRALPVAGPG